MCDKVKAKLSGGAKRTKKIKGQGQGRIIWSQYMLCQYENVIMKLRVMYNDYTNEYFQRDGYAMIDCITYCANRTLRSGEAS